MTPVRCAAVAAASALGACGGARPPERAPLVLPVGIVRVGAFDAQFFATGARPAIVDDRLIVLDHDYLHVSAYGLDDGALRWRAQVQDAAFGLQELFARPGRVLVHTGDAMIVLDAAQGAPVSRSSVTAQREGKACELWERREACALVCDCRMQPVACDDGHPLGPARDARITHTDYVGLDPPFTDDCLRDQPALIGRAGELVLYAIDREVFALDATTGAERWKREVGDADARGMSADRSVFWLGDWPDEDRDAVRVFASATGAPLWSERAPRSVGVTVSATDLGLVVTTLDRESRAALASLHDEATGALRWRVTLPRSTYALAVPARLGDHQIIGGTDASIAVLDARDGAQLYLARAASAFGDPDGGVEVGAGDRWVSLDPRGQPRPSPDGAGDQVAVAGGRTRITAPGGALLAELDGEYRLEARATVAGGERLVLGRYDDHGLRAIVFLRPVAAMIR
ncbi:MAG TPA: PQQ-binding-like beta-propeller repeat protein [Kofleriaceae bacterium]|nr:PQQ-binding-like beta-propeller repeat protein [Kofleriaceae bacterium]